MKVLIRKRDREIYLQPSGEWSPSRETAKQFENSSFALWWAREQQLLGIDILLAFEDPRWDFVPLRL